ncbi:UDP-glucuronate 5-epimerase, partial [Rhodobacter capsulatus]
MTVPFQKNALLTEPKAGAGRKVLLTGTAGFIGFHLARQLLAEGFRVQGYDGMTDYYDVTLKQRRHAILREHPNFTATEAMLED